MSSKDTTELDEITSKLWLNGEANRYDVKTGLSVAEARKALLLWRDKEVVKHLQTLYTNGMMNKMGDAYYLKLQSNLKEKE